NLDSLSDTGLTAGLAGQVVPPIPPRRLAFCLNDGQDAVQHLGDILVVICDQPLPASHCSSSSSRPSSFPPASSASRSQRCSWLPALPLSTIQICSSPFTSCTMLRMNNAWKTNRIHLSSSSVS